MDQQSPIAIVLLAAGESSRLGRPKQLLRYKGKSLLAHMVEIALASKADSTYVVLGAHLQELKSELDDPRVYIVENKDWQAGMSSSLQAGIKALPAVTHAALILLCDQPLTTTILLDTIISTYRSSGYPIVACEYASTVGVPALFSRRFFQEFLVLSGDKGAKQIIQRHARDVVTVPFPDGAVDIDMESDLDRLP